MYSPIIFKNSVCENKKYKYLLWCNVNEEVNSQYKLVDQKINKRWQRK